MTLLEQLNQIEERLEHAFGRNRFDTFNQLLAERISLLKKARLSADGGAVFALARKQAERWADVLSERMDLFRRQRVQSQALEGYGGVRTSRSGHMLNRSL